MVGAAQMVLSVTRVTTGNTSSRSLEEEIEAQEEQGAAQRKRSAVLRADITEKASKVPLSREWEHQGG